MLPIAPPVFPRTLNYGLQKLANLSRRKVRLTSVSGTAALPGGLVTVELPSEAIDLDTFQMYAKLTTTTTAGVASPASADMLIADYQLSAGGQNIGTSFADSYNQLRFLMEQYQGGDKATASSMLNNLLPSTSVGVFGIPAANLTNRAICISQWLGFIGSAAPRVIDLALLPKVQLTVRLADASVLVSGATAATGASFSLAEIAFECDVLSLPAMYYEAIQAHLGGGNVIEVPFTSYVPFRASPADIQGATQQFSVATGSLDAIIATFNESGNVNSKTWSGDVYNSANFARGSDKFKEVAVRINQVPFPAYGSMDSARCAMSVIESLMGSAYDTLGSCSTTLTSLTKFVGSHFAAVVRLNHHDGAYGNRLVCGMNTLGNPATVNITYSGNGTAQTITPMAWAVTTSIMRIGQYKQVEVDA